MQLVLFVGLALTVHFLRKVSQVEAPQSGLLWPHQGAGNEMGRTRVFWTKRWFFLYRKNIGGTQWIHVLSLFINFCGISAPTWFHKGLWGIYLANYSFMFWLYRSRQFKTIFCWPGENRTILFFDLVGWVVGGGGEGWAINAHVHMHTILTLRCWDLAGTCIQQGGWSGEWGGGVGY